MYKDCFALSGLLAPILNPPTKIKSPIILIAHVTAMNIIGDFESPKPRKIPLQHCIQL